MARDKHFFYYIFSLYNIHKRFRLQASFRLVQLGTNLFHKLYPLRNLRFLEQRFRDDYNWTHAVAAIIVIAAAAEVTITIYVPHIIIIKGRPGPISC